MVLYWSCQRDSELKSERPPFDVFLPSVLAGVQIIDEKEEEKIEIRNVQAVFNAPFLMYRYECRYSAIVPFPQAFVEFGKTYDHVVCVGPQKTSYEFLRDVPWYCFRGPQGRLAVTANMCFAKSVVKSAACRLTFGVWFLFSPPVRRHGSNPMKVHT